MGAWYGLQVHGVYGLSKEYQIERFFRDAKTYEFLEVPRKSSANSPWT